MAKGMWLSCYNQKKCTFTISETVSHVNGSEGAQAYLSVFGTGGGAWVGKSTATKHGMTAGVKVIVRPDCKRWYKRTDDRVKVGPDRYLSGDKAGQKWQPKQKSQGKERGAAKGW